MAAHYLKAPGHHPRLVQIPPAAPLPPRLLATTVMNKYTLNSIGND